MEAFVVGHGGHFGTDTFVPVGRTVKFYAEFDTALLVTASLLGLASGGATARRTVAHDPRRGTDDIRNYVLTPHVDDTVAQHLAARPRTPDVVAFFVGTGESAEPGVRWLAPTADGLPLCTSPVDCRVAWPNHAAGCRGLFAAVPAEFPVIHLLCCRVDHLTSGTPLTVAVGHEPEVRSDRGRQPGAAFPAADGRVVPAIVTKARDISPVELESLTPPTQAQLVTAVPDRPPVWAGMHGLEPEQLAHVRAAVAFHPGEEAPAELGEAWRQEDWRNAFWAYCHADGTSASVGAYLLAYDVISACLDDPGEKTVLSADWPRLLDPGRHPSADVPADRYALLEELSGELSRLLVLRDDTHDDVSAVARSVAPETAAAFGDPEADPELWLAAFRAGAPALIHTRLAELVEGLRAEGERLAAELAPYYADFGALIHAIVERDAESSDE
ncbi:putative adhesin [Amycolatopsis sp. NBC_00438]|uniref:putative adhesin n=1 Tax=Amycolatopsis sp. NBC_00438 TaxID=2903558 RepID=UPI002E1DE201